MECDVLILFLARDLMTRPWCLIELYTAIKHDVPNVALKVCGNYPELWTFCRTPPRCVIVSSSQVLGLEDCD